MSKTVYSCVIARADIYDSISFPITMINWYQNTSEKYKWQDLE